MLNLQATWIFSGVTTPTFYENPDVLSVLRQSLLGVSASKRQGMSAYAVGSYATHDDEYEHASTKWYNTAVQKLLQQSNVNHYGHTESATSAGNAYPAVGLKANTPSSRIRVSKNGRSLV